MTKLKSCPFCGGEAMATFANESVDYTDKKGNINFTRFLYTVVCRDIYCGCGIGAYEDVNMAIEAWNRRADND